MDKPKSLISLHPISQPKMAPDTPDAKLVKVGVPPIESRLNRQVKLVEAPSQRYDQLSPNRRLDVVKGNPEFDRV